MKLELLKEWERNIKASDEVLSQLNEPLSKAVESLQKAYTDAITKLVGDTTEDLLRWYWKDNAMGANDYRVCVNLSDGLKSIKNAEQLLELIGTIKNYEWE
jgi:hypothetical protein